MKTVPVFALVLLGAIVSAEAVALQGMTSLVHGTNAGLSLLVWKNITNINYSELNKFRFVPKRTMKKYIWYYTTKTSSVKTTSSIQQRKMTVVQ